MIGRDLSRKGVQRRASVETAKKIKERRLNSEREEAVRRQCRKESEEDGEVKTGIKEWRGVVKSKCGGERLTKRQAKEDQ